MNHHNPITIRLDEMVNVWNKNVRPHHRLIRWMLKPEDHRMYEGFCRFEASPYGKLDNLFVFFYTPFTSAETFCHALMENWLHEYDDPKQRQLLQKAGVSREWDVRLFRNAVDNKDYAACDNLIHAMIASYKQIINQVDAPFVFSLLPKQISHPQHVMQWMTVWMRKATNTQLLVFDHVDGNFWGPVFEEHAAEAVTLQHDLRMQEAIRQIATAGAATDPYAFFRKCMFGMGDASVKKNKDLLINWGEKAIESAQKTGDKNLLATAYISFAGMLFGFKDHDRIGALLNTGMRLCKQEIAGGKDDLKPLLLQFYTYKGADLQLQKERKEALQWFIKAGDEAVAFAFVQLAISSYYKAFVFAEYKNWNEDKMLVCKKALQLTNRLSTEDIQASEYPFMAYAWVHEKQDNLAEFVDEKMNQVYGQDWRHTVEELKQNYTKQKLREAEKGLVIN
jgi:hypothetical protein